MANNRCFLCGRRMLNDVQCSNEKCSRHKLPKELETKLKKESETDSKDTE